MAIVKQYNRPVQDAGRLDATENIDSTGLALRNFGLSVISTTGAYALGNPVAGLRKVVVGVGASTGDTAEVTGAGATIAGSTSVSVASQDAVELVGLSTAAWAIVSLSTL